MQKDLEQSANEEQKRLLELAIIEQKAIAAVNKWLPNMRYMISGIEYGIAQDRTGRIDGFDELYQSAGPILTGDKIAMVLASMRGSYDWKWYALPL